MGFLSGAYGKLMAGRLVRQLQWQLTSVTNRYNRVTKQIGDMEESLQRQERSYNMYNMNVFNQMRMGMMSGVDQSNSTSYNNFLMGTQQLQYQMMQQQSMMAEQFDIMRDAQLEPLKAIQEQLETQKDNLESRLEVAKGQYEAKKKEEQDGAKNIVPDYTGGQG